MASQGAPYVPGFIAKLDIILSEPMVWLALAVLSLALAYGGAALVGRAIWRRIPDSRMLRHRSLRTHVMLATIGGLTVPIAAIALGALYLDLEEREHVARVVLRADSSSAAAILASWMSRHRLRVVALADGLSSDPPADGEALRRRLERHLRANAGLRTMLATDRAGRIVAAVSADDIGDRLAAKLLGSSVADRGYFREPMRTGRPFISAMFRGRGFADEAIFAIAAPIGATRRDLGIVEASVTSAAIGELLAPIASSRRAGLMVLDPDGRLAFAAPDWRQPLLGRPMATSDDAWLQERTTSANGWTVALRSDPAPLQAAALARFRLLFAGLTVAGFAAVGLVALIVRRLTRPILRLTAALQTFDLTRASEPLHISRYSPRELRSLFAGFGRLQRRLTRADHGLRRALDEEARLRVELEATLRSRDAVIVERTRELAAANDRLVELARTDPLTGLPNRRAFEDHLRIALDFADRVQRPLALAMVDVDHFKAYNDAYGHPAGDACLRRVAEALRSATRRSLDLVARYGGEEFVIVLAITDGPLAAALADAARRAVSDLAIPHRGAAGGVVTVSIGVAELDLGAARRAEDLIARADAALYSAKRAGRDRVVLDQRS